MTVMLTAALLAAAATTAQADTPNAANSQTRSSERFANVSEAGRARLATEAKAIAERGAEARTAYAQAQEAVASALAKDPIDLPALTVALEARDKVMNNARAKQTEEVLKLLSALSAEDRTIVAREVIEGAPKAEAQAKAKPRPAPSPTGR